MNCHNNNIDQIITEYDIRTDPVLTSIWKEITEQMWEQIESYGAGVNDYGRNTLAPHLTRIAKDSRDFLLYLKESAPSTYNFPECTAHNFYDAMKISDLGKTHEEFDVEIWKLPYKPTEEQREEKREHTTRGLEVLEKFIKDAPQGLLDHPHIKHVVPIHMHGHHTRLKDNPDMGLMMEVACIVDAYDGDMDAKKITHGDGSTRSAKDQLNRMLAPTEAFKYRGYFREELVHQYFDFRVEKRALKL